MPIMPYMRQVIMGAGWSLMLALTGTSTQADPWYREHGLASYYGKGFHGRTAADGDRFSQNEMTAAHRNLPLGTKVMVENRTTGEQVDVRKLQLPYAFEVYGRPDAAVLQAIRSRPGPQGASPPEGDHSISQPAAAAAGASVGL